MVLLKSSVKNEIIKLIKDGKSLGDIIKLTSVNKTTIYYHMKKIRGKKYLPVKIKLHDIGLIGEIVGIFAGDGHYVNDKKRWDYRIRIFFNSNELNLAKYYKTSFDNITGKNSGFFVSGSVIILQIHSKEFCDFLMSYFDYTGRKVKNIQLKNKALLKNRLFVKGFLRGLVDSDGYVRKGRKEIYYGSISKDLFNDFLVALDFFNFVYKTYTQKGSKYSDFYKVRLSGNEVDRFVKLIKPLKSKF